MHIGYLTLACRDLLRDYLKADGLHAIPDLDFIEEEIQVMPEGRPPAVAGDKFIGIYGSSWEPAVLDSNVAIDAYMGINCVISIRSSIYPQEKLEDMYADVSVGMAAIAVAIMKSLAQNTAIYTYLSNYTNYQSYWTFEFLRWAGTDPEPQERGDEWFSAKNQHLLDPAGQDIMGYTMTVRFSQARAGMIPGV